MALILTLTAIVTVSVDLIYAVGVGILAAAFFALRRLAKSAGFIVRSCRHLLKAVMSESHCSGSTVRYSSVLPSECSFE